MYITLHKTQVNSSSNSTEYSLNLQTDPVNSIDYLPYLVSLQEMVLIYQIENLQHSIEQTMNVLDTNYPYSFNIVISILIYSAFVSRKSDIDLYLNYLEALENKEKEINENYKIIEIFINHICKMKSQETFYIIFHMNERNLIKEDISKLFNQFHTKGNTQYYNIFYDYYDKHSNNQMKNNNKLDDKLIKEGNNPNEIAKIIRNDEIEKLQEISSQHNFDFNQIIKPSPYERCSFVNEENVTLIDYAAFFSSVKCFKYLLVNGAKLESTGKYAIAGGNLEILHLCEQNHTLFENAYETAVKFHRNDNFHYLYENKIEKINNLGELGVKCVLCYNFEILIYLIDDGMKINDNVINESVRNGNIFLVQYFFQNNQIPKDILLNISNSSNLELVKYILKQEGININAKSIYLFNLDFILII